MSAYTGPVEAIRASRATPAPRPTDYTRWLAQLTVWAWQTADARLASVVWIRWAPVPVGIAAVVGLIGYWGWLA